MDRLTHRSPIQLPRSHLAEHGIVDPRTPPIAGKKADILHYYPRLLIRDFERPAQRFHNDAHPFERLGHRGIVELARRFYIHDHQAVVGKQQIVRNVTTNLPAKIHVQHERLRHNVIHRLIKVRQQQARQFET